MKILRKTILLLTLGSLCNTIQATNFADVSVHDPSIMKTNDGTFYIVGSHMAGAKTKDLMRWTQLSTTVSDQKFFQNIGTTLGEASSWSQSNTFWAGDWIRLSDGKYYMYYCACKGDSPQSCIGYATSNNPEGPYTNMGLLLKSSASKLTLTNPSNGSTFNYNSNVHPNAVDPNVFFDANGNFWMVYGSYSGGIFILKMDPKTGKPAAGQDYYGKKILGGNHCRIEAPYILYSPDTKYYYLFLSFGGLDSYGGYNIRVCRSKTPDGPYYDAKGNNMINCIGTSGKYLEAQDGIISNYGVKLMGNYQFNQVNGEVKGTAQGYVSPGHNSAYYDANMKKYFIIFHARFPGKGELHSVRVHQMFMNEDGWPVIAPFRYGGETIGNLYETKEIVGDYKFINHGNAVSKEINYSSVISLKEDGSISGAVNGRWTTSDNKNVTMTINNVEYKGVFLSQTDFNTGYQTMTFTLVGGKTGNALWGAKINYKEHTSEIENNATYFIMNAYSGLYVDIPNGVNEDGTNLQQWEFNGLETQQYRLSETSNGGYNISSVCSGNNQFVTVENNSAEDGANIETRSHSSNDDQRFEILPNADGTFRILSYSSNKTRGMEDYDFGKTNGSNIAQWEYWGGEQQHWVLTKVDHAQPEDQTCVKEPNDNNLVVYAENGLIECNARITKIFDVNGINVTDSNGSLPKGIYIVECDKVTFKVVMRD